MQQLLASLKSGGKEAVKEIIQDLRERAGSISQLQRLWFDILREKGQG